jgi:hypothetical protein
VLLLCGVRNFCELRAHESRRVSITHFLRECHNRGETAVQIFTVEGEGMTLNVKTVVIVAVIAWAAMFAAKRVAFIGRIVN